jgi:hypothetical protein
MRVILAVIMTRIRQVSVTARQAFERIDERWFSLTTPVHPTG